MKNLITQPAGQIFDQVLESVRTFSLDQAFDDDVCLVGLDYVCKPVRMKC